MHINLTVPDMSCDHCKQSVLSVLKGLDGIANVEIDLAKKTVGVCFEGLDKKVIQKAL